MTAHRSRRQTIKMASEPKGRRSKNSGSIDPTNQSNESNPAPNSLPSVCAAVLQLDDSIGSKREEQDPATIVAKDPTTIVAKG